MNVKVKGIWIAIGLIALVITIGIVGFIYFSSIIEQPSIMPHRSEIKQTSEISTSVSVREGVAPLTVAFTAPSYIAPILKKGNPSYDWDFGDGTTGTGRIVVHTYEKPGGYIAIVKGEDEFGHIFRETIKITVR